MVPCTRATDRHTTDNSGADESEVTEVRSPSAESTTLDSFTTRCTRPRSCIAERASLTREFLHERGSQADKLKRAGACLVVLRLWQNVMINVRMHALAWVDCAGCVRGRGW